MNMTPQSVGDVAMPGEVALAAATEARRPSKLWRGVLFPIKFFWGMAFCQGLLGSVLVVGWACRLAQRAMLKFWWSRRSPACQQKSFEQFLRDSERTVDYLRWPNWFARQNLREELALQSGATRYALTLARGIIRSLWQNLRLGFGAMAGTFVLTLPSGLLWWFGWYDGWNNSFAKGYEQAPVGPLISIAGIFWFIGVMFYLPLAQARQAATGQCRTLFQFGRIWQLVRIRWLSCVGLAMLYSLLALPLNILKAAPVFWTKSHPAFADLPPDQIIKQLDGYFFWCALWLLPAYALLRVVAARIYASAVLQLTRNGALAASDLSEREHDALTRLGLLEAQPQPQRHFFVRLIAWTGTRLGRACCAFALGFIWFTFVAQIYISEFFNYHRSGMGWLNQPLVQLPWFHYLPANLKNPWGEVAGTLVLCGAVALAWSAARRATRLVRREG